jgi:hypothetical protein
VPVEPLLHLAVVPGQGDPQYRNGRRLFQPGTMRMKMNLMTWSWTMVLMKMIRPRQWRKTMSMRKTT